MLSWRMALMRTLGIKARAAATIVPQSTVAADVTCSEDEPNLMPGNAVGMATPAGVPVGSWSTRKTEGRGQQHRAMRRDKITRKQQQAAGNGQWVVSSHSLAVMLALALPHAINSSA
eukprot:CAMPEP_0174379302 /NCGR_PEP_ID=MMETSP0811_2-20130205/122616_1 /TAXON_ID=73025 ORGANISM="Eutreptiella gymnastica-like, Strain CCMP1594" /NCGR_SAMPLE_ID=MMETSP0811_2 /ASSEMBLY_ACC=CAM_ASM_000667 /LENGTH=116 /DNA_ID=CAMNT_0015531795 /DNA_START=1165 /DNA_END=1516 /DNA_ORIENTATION=-